MNKGEIMLKNMSSKELIKLSKKAMNLAKDLEKDEPSYQLAIEHGIVDEGYNTTANGWVNSYSGMAEITMENGKRWKALGRRCGGDAYYAIDGYIEFIPLN